MEWLRAKTFAAAIAIAGCSDMPLGPESVAGDWRHTGSCCPPTSPWPPETTILSLDSTGTATLRHNDSVLSHMRFFVEGASSIRLRFQYPIMLPLGCHPADRFQVLRQVPETMTLALETTTCTGSPTAWTFVREP